MRRTKQAFIVVATLALPVAMQSAPPKGRGPQPAASYKALQYPPLNDIKPPQPVRFELPNGIVVYLVEDHELPTVSASAMIRAGDRWEPAGKAGLASLTGTVMRTGGTPARSGDQLDEELDRLGAQVETEIGEDSGQATVSVLKEDINTGLEILADILQNPAFPQDKIDLAKITMRDAIARRNDDPAGIADREFTRLIYGKDSAYGQIPEYNTVESITREDLVEFHKKFFQPENVIVGVWGDFKAAEMQAMIQKALGSWAKGEQPKPPVPELEPGARDRAGLYVINKEDVNQSNVLMGFVGGKRNDPDYFALSVANTVLGYGFSSRLVSNVRSDQGLAYSVGSAWRAGWDRPGLFRAGGGTKSGSTVKFINAVRDEIRKMSEGVTETEVSLAKDTILKGYAFDFDSTGKIVRRMMTYDYFGYPADYLQQYRANIDKVTVADVLRVAKQYLKPDSLAVLVLGKEKEFDQPLSALGKATPIDISIPPLKRAVRPDATPEMIAQGKALLTAARDAMGGAAVLKVKDYAISGSRTVSARQGEFTLKMEQTHNLSGKILDRMTTPVGDLLQAFDGQVYWGKAPQGVQEMTDEQKAEVQGRLFRDTFNLLQGFETNGWTVQALGPADVAGKAAETVSVSDPARKFEVTLYVDASSKLLLKKVYTAALTGAPAETEEVLLDYRDVHGMKLPFKIVTSQGGNKLMEQTILEWKINPGVPAAAYKKP